MVTTTWAETIRTLADAAEEAGVFATVSANVDRLECQAKDAAAPAFYRVDQQKGGACVSLVTPDRWLSQSIEQDLVHTKDKLADLVDEELAEVGFRGPKLAVEHYRSDDKLYTFITRLGQAPASTLRAYLLAYEAAFRNLGDMPGGDD